MNADCMEGPWPVQVTIPCGSFVPILVPEHIVFFFYGFISQKKRGGYALVPSSLVVLCYCRFTICVVDGGLFFFWGGWGTIG